MNFPANSVTFTEEILIGKLHFYEVKNYRRLFESIKRKSKKVHYSEKLLQFQGDGEKGTLHSNYLQFCSNSPVKLAIFLKCSLLFNNFYCFFLFINKILQRKSQLNF